jgi:hypothetical protein
MRWDISDKLLPVLKSAGTTVEIEHNGLEVAIWVDGVPLCGHREAGQVVAASDAG